ncbi:hypothetical protein AMECASPLE_018436 [Ameca splendens]|uniref:Uncharacterized protein n=1 Tax=Ameca splendens TaxID=208324 RepID=A0ABV0ZBI0_9TELE
MVTSGKNHDLISFFIFLTKESTGVVHPWLKIHNRHINWTDSGIEARPKNHRAPSPAKLSCCGKDLTSSNEPSSTINSKLTTLFSYTLSITPTQQAITSLLLSASPDPSNGSSPYSTLLCTYHK